MPDVCVYVGVKKRCTQKVALLPWPPSHCPICRFIYNPSHYKEITLQHRVLMIKVSNSTGFGANRPKVLRLWQEITPLANGRHCDLMEFAHYRALQTKTNTHPTQVDILIHDKCSPKDLSHLYSFNKVNK